MENSLLLNILSIVVFIVSVFSLREYKTARIISLVLIESLIIMLSIDTMDDVIPGLMIVFGLFLIPYTPDRHIWESNRDEECIAEQQEPKN